jgi:hypothetical protein
LSFPQPAKPDIIVNRLRPDLKSCPDTKQRFAQLAKLLRVRSE